MFRTFCCVLLIALGGALTGSVTASTFLTAEFREVVADATTIVRGRVTDVRAVRSAAGDVESVVTIAVDRVLKGRADAAGPVFVSMRLPGGTIGRFRTVMTGVPTLRPGDAGFFFLKAGPAGTFWPVGLSQGIYRITTARVGDTPLVAAPLIAGLTTNAVGRVVRGDARRKPVSIPQFESFVQLALAAESR